MASDQHVHATARASECAINEAHDASERQMLGLGAPQAEMAWSAAEHRIEEANAALHHQRAAVHAADATELAHQQRVSVAAHHNQSIGAMAQHASVIASVPPMPPPMFSPVRPIQYQ